MKRPFIIIIFLFNVLFFQQLIAQNTTVAQYIDTFKNIAMREMLEYKIPASITLAQGLLESGSGNSRLAKQGNNHFGIKCKKDWTGCSILEDDDELQECFRCYTTAEESYKDHSKFLKANKRYAALFLLEISDYKGWAKGLLAAGYATNQKYTDLLIGCIERNKLAKYDTMILKGYNPYGTYVEANIEIINPKNVPNTVVQPNQTVEKIAEQYQKTEKKLERYNDLAYHQIKPGDVLYLKPKKRKASIALHTVSEGETMWLISQKYAIKLNALYTKNLMEKGTEAKVGSVLNLQKKANNMPDTGRLEAHKTIDTNYVRNTTVPNMQIHTVIAGETLYSIATKYNLTLEMLKSINHLQNNSVYEGQKLNIKKIVENKTNNKTHTVKSGETLYSIAKMYGISITEIKTWNKLNSENLQVGQVLQLQKQ